MSEVDQGQGVRVTAWLSLTEAARRTGHSREALRQRVRRGKLRAQMGNDGQLRINEQDLADLPPPSQVDQERPGSTAADTTLDVLRMAVDDLRSTASDLRQALEHTRTALDTAQADHLVDRGRAERAEARAEAEAARATAAEARLVATEAALAEARTPWAVRVVRALRPGTR
jgi:hypothetical protein